MTFHDIPAGVPAGAVATGGNPPLSPKSMPPAQSVAQTGSGLDIAGAAVTLLPDGAAGAMLLHPFLQPPPFPMFASTVSSPCA